MSQLTLTPEAFLDAQLEAWPMARNNFEALKGVETRTIEMPGLMDIKVQFNPARRVSSAAKVDAASLRERKCFLCAANRPQEQMLMPWQGKDAAYEVLINPFPIFPRHFTIPDTGHVRQNIAGRIEDMCSLAQEMPGLTLFYNGPRCGASAPDHMHFQAGNTDFLPLPGVLDSVAEPMEAGASARIWTVAGLPLGVAVIDSFNPADSAELFDAFVAQLPRGDEECAFEPMMNILCYVPADAPAGLTRLVVIPRKAHRPEFYSTESLPPQGWLISPASVDMGGVFITPREEDFRAIDASTIRKILDELCYTPAEVDALIEKI